MICDSYLILSVYIYSVGIDDGVVNLREWNLPRACRFLRYFAVKLLFYTNLQ